MRRLSGTDEDSGRIRRRWCSATACSSIPQDRLFKMWYMGGYGGTTCLATSADGIDVDTPGVRRRAGHQHRLARRSAIRAPSGSISRSAIRSAALQDVAVVQRRSARALRRRPTAFTGRASARTGCTGDRSTFFYNPFRKVWVFSLRANQYVGSISGRYRKYWESREFAAAPNVEWSRAGRLGQGRLARFCAARDARRRPELYNLDCVAYESLMLGLFSIWRGESSYREKINEVTLGFSRDGFHWHRPDRTAFLPVSEDDGSWNWANVQSAGGGCLIVGDQLLLLRERPAGPSGHRSSPGVCTTGLATLRRDGFASMDWHARRRARSRRHGTGRRRRADHAADHVHRRTPVRQRGCERRRAARRGARRVGHASSRRSRASVRAGHRQRHAGAASRGATAIARRRGRPHRSACASSMTRRPSVRFWVSAGTGGQSGGYPAAGGPDFAGPIDAPGAVDAISRGASARPRRSTVAVAVADHPSAWDCSSRSSGPRIRGAGRASTRITSSPRRWRAASRSAPPTCRGATPTTRRCSIGSFGDRVWVPLLGAGHHQRRRADPALSPRATVGRRNARPPSRR